MKRPLILLALILCGGCLSTTYVSPTGERFSRQALGNKTAIGSLTLYGPDGKPRLQLKGYGNDQVEALGIVTEAAVRGAVGAVKP